MIASRLIGDDAALTQLRSVPESANSSLARAIARLGIELQRKVQYDKLAGQLLAARSGALKSSIGLRVDQSATTVRATVSTDLDYATAHEFGFSGTVNVRAGLRRIKEAFGRPIAEKVVRVRGHSRRVNLPERAFLRSALEDLKPTIYSDVGNALREAVGA